MRGWIKMTSGWKNESQRHALASKGIKTGNITQKKVVKTTKLSDIEMKNKTSLKNRVTAISKIYGPDSVKTKYIKEYIEKNVEPNNYSDESIVEMIFHFQEFDNNGSNVYSEWIYKLYTVGMTPAQVSRYYNSFHPDTHNRIEDLMVKRKREYIENNIPKKYLDNINVWKEQMNKFEKESDKYYDDNIYKQNQISEEKYGKYAYLKGKEYGYKFRVYESDKILKSNLNPYKPYDQNRISKFENYNKFGPDDFKQEEIYAMEKAHISTKFKEYFSKGYEESFKNIQRD